jgi:hypothetical protein
VCVTFCGGKAGKQEMDKNGNSLELIVRVKRKREVESIPSICIVESSDTSNNIKKRTKLTSQFQRLLRAPHEEQGMEGGHEDKKLILKKIQTLDELPPMMSSYSSLQERTRYALPAGNGMRTGNSKYVMTSSSKYVENSSNIFMVDFDHLPSALSSLSSPHKQSNLPVTKGKKILDPATRSLHAAFDLSDPTQMIQQMLNAMDQGADINSQRSSDGLTALMIAAQYSQIRLLSKLLQKGANVFLQNQDTKSAIDFAEYADIENRSDASKQVLFLLRHAVSSQYSANFSPPAIPSGISSSDGDRDYVYDIYSLGKSLLSAQDGSSADSPQETAADQQEEDDDAMEIPTIEVPGIKILSGDLKGELTFCYDSDWSDLADDEDPDSNDEKFFGNDYPDEDWGDNDNDGNEDDGEEDGDGCRAGCYNDNHDSDYNQSSDDDDGYGFQRNRGRWNPNDGQGQGEGDDDDKMPKFDQKGVGRVLKPFLVHGPNGTSSNDKIDINELWNLRPDGAGGPEEEEEHQHDRGGRGMSHETRKEDMARRTGMMIGSSEREFESNGLPKYGMDLSDDDGDVDWTHATGGGGFDRSNYNQEAYDSDLDRSSSSNC